MLNFIGSHAAGLGGIGAETQMARPLVVVP